MIDVEECHKYDEHTIEPAGNGTQSENYKNY